MSKIKHRISGSPHKDCLNGGFERLRPGKLFRLTKAELTFKKSFLGWLFGYKVPSNLMIILEEVNEQQIHGIESVGWQERAPESFHSVMDQLGSKNDMTLGDLRMCGVSVIVDAFPGEFESATKKWKEQLKQIKEKENE